jgi:hypothetical protein
MLESPRSMKERNLNPDPGVEECAESQDHPAEFPAMPVDHSSYLPRFDEAKTWELPAELQSLSRPSIHDSRVPLGKTRAKKSRSNWNMAGPGFR